MNFVRRLIGSVMGIMTVVIDASLRIAAFICCMLYIDKVARLLIDEANDFSENSAIFIENM